MVSKLGCLDEPQHGLASEVISSPDRPHLLIVLQFKRRKVETELCTKGPAIAPFSLAAQDLYGMKLESDSLFEVKREAKASKEPLERIVKVKSKKP